MYTKFIKLALAAIFLIGLSACDNSDSLSGTPSTSGSTTTTTTSTTVPNAATVQLGSGTGASFTPGVLELGLTSLSAGGTTAVTATLVDSNGNLYTTPTDVSFSSTCKGQNLATIGSPITATDGFAITSYTATGCSGTDTITALATVDGTTISATGTVTIQAATAGSIVFVSASPASIGIKGTGSVESSTLTFKVLDTSGAPLANQTVTYSLNTTVGGITMSTTTDTSDNLGVVTTVVNSGTVSTVVRVTAVLDSNIAIATQSDGLVISTGLADQNSFSLASSSFNIEGWGYDGEFATLTIHASDHFNNPVPDGTSVYFTAEGGQVEPTCTVAGGTCQVTYTSSDPRPADGRVTITATMQGEESFSDSDGNGLLDDGELYHDLPEAFFDYNENGVYDATTALMDSFGNTYYEEYRDFNTNGIYDAADGAYNGVLCNPSNTVITCSSTKSLDVRRNIVMVLSGSFATGSSFGTSPLALSGGFGSTTVTIADARNNPMPAGTTIAVKVGSTLKLESLASFTTASSNAVGGLSYPIAVSVADLTTNPTGSSLVSITVTTPNGNETYLSLPVTW